MVRVFLLEALGDRGLHGGSLVLVGIFILCSNLRTDLGSFPMLLLLFLQGLGRGILDVAWEIWSCLPPPPNILLLLYPPPHLEDEEGATGK